MTNQPTPQQLLEIARVVKPNITWRIYNGDVRQFLMDMDDNPAYYFHFEPHKNTERGQAQLMKVVFAVYRNCLDGRLITLFGMAIAREDVNDMLSLAHEVLCN